MRIEKKNKRKKKRLVIYIIVFIIQMSLIVSVLWLVNTEHLLSEAYKSQTHINFFGTVFEKTFLLDSFLALALISLTSILLLSVFYFTDIFKRDYRRRS